MTIKIKIMIKTKEIYIINEDHYGFEHTVFIYKVNTELGFQFFKINK